MSDEKLYRFVSKSQQIIMMSHKGRRIRLGFGAPYMGISRFSTSDAELAEKVRKTAQFKTGVIKEEKAVEINKSSPIPTKPTTQSTTPPLLQNGGEIRDEKNKPQPSTTVKSEGEDEKTNKVEQGELFPMELKDVENYMDAKHYVTEVLKADVSTKSEVKAYCKEHGIVFPNWEWE